MVICLHVTELGERASVTLKPGASQEQERPQTVPKASKVSFGGRSSLSFLMLDMT